MNDVMSNDNDVVGSREVCEAVSNVSVCRDKRQVKVRVCVREELK